MRFTELRDTRRLLWTLIDFRRIVNNSTEAISDVILTTRSIKRLINHQEDSSLGSRLIKAGIVCIALPEPLFSNIVGSMLIATGALLRRSNSLSVMDAIRSINMVMDELKMVQI